MLIAGTIPDRSLPLVHGTVSRAGDYLVVDGQKIPRLQGTGVMISGGYLPAGGTADVYLDGKLDRKIDVFSDSDGPRGGNAIWHTWGLKNGKHTVRVVVSGEPFRDSKGTQIAIDDAIIFRR